MTLSNSVYFQMMQSVKEKKIKREFEVKEEDVVNDDAYIGGSYHLGGNGLKKKVFKGISDEEVYKLQFDCIDEAETFYNMTNAYKKPLVVLVGVNHHHQTVVFGYALLIDESVGTYEWVLETFLDAMMNKRPISVVTDGDKAMHKAIKKVLPDTCHRLCSWHLQRNAFTNVHIKDFSSIFARCMFMRGNEEEFEKVWHEMVANLGLNENRWVTEIYGKRKRWAEAYLRGNFFGGMRTTQRFNWHPMLPHGGGYEGGAFGRDSLVMHYEEVDKVSKDTSSSFIEAKNEIQNLTARMEELYNYNLKWKKIAADGATGTNQVRDPNIVKTKGNPGKVAMNVQKGRRCSRCKRVGHTIRKCPEATIPQNAQSGYMEETNLSSQCDIQMEMMPSTNSSVDIFATIHGMLGEHLSND
ncbi:Protein FAR1-related sequence 7 [Vitis vinifera]|uniref:Protein FAR1-related sequence 7 n=1 Tax=Vitis vinifera TaxID=29760 RepID=A0A438FIC4_VITVI|nr:Protein FAR1-related sequence 7 [Vitis vinifera]